MLSSVRSYRPGLSAAILLCSAVSAIAASAQTPIPANDTNNPPPLPPEIPYILHVSTREVLVDVIAVDSRDQPVVNLMPADLQVVEKSSHSPDVPMSISSLRLIDPTAADPGSLPGAGFRIAANESCLQRQTVHYEVAYHPGPQGLTSGYHQVLIRSSRRGLHLFYRHSYYIGVTAPPENPPQKSQSEIGHELQIDACSHPVAPLSISLQAFRISTGSESLVRYSVRIESGSLDFVSYPENRHQLQLDYGACNFNAVGKPIGYMHASTDQVLTSIEFARAQAHGFNHLFDFTPPNDLAMTRFVVRDRTTGNLGLVDVTFPLLDGPAQSDPSVTAEFRKELARNAQSPPFSMYSIPPMGPIGSFGSVVPRPGAFCGDVYELQANILSLPDFRDLDPIGSIYTDSLAVPNQIFEGTNGIPGVTDRTIWFGVDYHAAFWIHNAGTYDFKMTSDDGAALQIDDKRVIDLDGLHPALTEEGRIKLDAGRHAIHVPYYEGTPYAVALSLWVRNPGEEDWKIFDLRDFANSRKNSSPLR